MNSYFASQLIADRQAAVAADVAHRAQLKEARAARRAVVAAASAGRRPVPAGCCSAGSRMRAPENPGPCTIAQASGRKSALFTI